MPTFWQRKTKNPEAEQERNEPPDPDEGWVSWMYRRPPKVLIQVWRPDGKYPPTTIMPDDLFPESQACGLYWRLTGIAKEKLDALPADVRAQMECSSDFMVSWGGSSGARYQQLNIQAAQQGGTKCRE